VTGAGAAGSAGAARARWSVTAVFFLVGLMLSAWFTQIPQFKSELGLTDGQLGAALLFPAGGALASMQVAGRLAGRFGSSPVLRAAGVTIAAAMPLLGWSGGSGGSGGFAAFAAALLLFGFADGMLDVAMNAQAVAVERMLGRPVLQSMHAAFSLGTIGGAASGGAAIYLGLSPLAYLGVMGAVAVILTAGAGARLLPASADRAAPDDRDGTRGAGGGPPQRRARAGWTGYVVVLGLLGAGCLLAEGAAESWSAVFLRDQRHAAPALATAGYLVFTVVQLGGRLLGDRLHLRWGPVALVRRGAAVAAAGLCLELAAPGAGWSVLGIALYSLGLAGLVPIIFGAVGHRSAAEHGAASVTGAVARFTTISYLGYLLGPASIGWLAQAAGLTWALAAVFLVLAAVIGFARLTSPALPGQGQQAVQPGQVPA